ALTRAAVLLNQGNTAAALPLLRSTTAAAPASADAHLAHARGALAAGAFEESTLAAARAVVLRPTSGPAWRVRAQAYDQLRFRSDAVVAYDAAVVHSAQEPELWSERGLALLALQRFDDGLASAQRALELDPRHALGRFVASLALDALGRRDEAVRSYQQFLGIAPQAMATPMRHARERLAELQRG
ncbi:MAG: tetratricopeptide repeat protein, partial [Myxococcaceae bacterium]|nr:tetratricopeptide repeat protein [Myxococcaceae bacterium]